MPRLRLCEIGKNGYICLKPTIHDSLLLLRVGTNIVDISKELDLNNLVKSVIKKYICSECITFDRI